MEHQFRKISVIGLGYIGLPTAAMFASRKVEVVGVDINQDAVDTINRGGIHIIEPDLDMVVHAAVHEGYLRATTNPEAAEAFLIAVPTPFKGEDHEPDLSYIEAASKAIAPVLEKGNLVILESTSPVGATEAMANWLAAARPDLTFPQHCGQESDIRIAHCPERVLPGKVMQELIANDRVIGGMTMRCSKLAATLYETFVVGECVLATGPRVAEMAKLTENSFRDVNIAFANELSVICDKLQMDVWELISLANRHPRVNILQPGPGVGGHCIAVDPWFIVSSAPKESRLIRMAREVNDAKPTWVLRQIVAAMPSEDYPVIFYGATFKADIDDVRESPSLAIVKKAQLILGDISVVEPNTPLGHEGFRQIDLSDARNADALHVGLVAHREFETAKPTNGICLDFARVWE
ncbi:UDP-N-acetyl-D-mannosamine dehydrogenase [Erythrobacter sp.]|uniref:UDP-N-acetyl-D-mannosamine dehydrogenase n=1 Tax=Erythrobacter sp. TaxID=1042 RepID=UPI001425F6B2|nr:UDP-N-acetyl-D-mannosamine dehydrogenase [Erythrobacter sp.]QIQ87532.1 MAG: UDP-N-acetyl-D-mannosamine dehydrogenase [Erythrobacter sp.]